MGQTSPLFVRLIYSHICLQISSIPNLDACALHKHHFACQNTCLPVNCCCFFSENLQVSLLLSGYNEWEGGVRYWGLRLHRVMASEAPPRERLHRQGHHSWSVTNPTSSVSVFLRFMCSWFVVVELVSWLFWVYIGMFWSFGLADWLMMDWWWWICGVRDLKGFFEPFIGRFFFKTIYNYTCSENLDRLLDWWFFFWKNWINHRFIEKETEQHRNRVTRSETQSLIDNSGVFVIFKISRASLNHVEVECFWVLSICCLGFRNGYFVSFKVAPLVVMFMAVKILGFIFP